MHIKVKARRVYGQTRYYPDNQAAVSIAAIARSATLTPEVIMYTRKAGATIECTYSAGMHPGLDTRLFHVLTPITPINIKV